MQYFRSLLLEEVRRRRPWSWQSLEGNYSEKQKKRKTLIFGRKKERERESKTEAMDSDWGGKSIYESIEVKNSKLPNSLESFFFAMKKTKKKNLDEKKLGTFWTFASFKTKQKKRCKFGKFSHTLVDVN